MEGGGGGKGRGGRGLNFTLAIGGGRKGKGSLCWYIWSGGDIWSGGGDIPLPTLASASYIYSYTQCCVMFTMETHNDMSEKTTPTLVTFALLVPAVSGDVLYALPW